MFTCLETCDNKFKIHLNEEAFLGEHCYGSLNVVAARILGISYPNYLRYMRDNYAATIRGKNGYPYLVFDTKEDCNEAIKFLNSYWRQFTKQVNLKTLEKNKPNIDRYLNKEGINIYVTKT